MPRGIGTSPYLFVPQRVVFLYIKKVKVDLSVARCPRVFSQESWSQSFSPSFPGRLLYRAKCHCVVQWNGAYQHVGTGGLSYILSSTFVGALRGLMDRLSKVLC